MNDKDKNSVSVKKQVTAGILGTFKGRVSSFNQHQIICLIALIILILICIANLGFFPAIFTPLLYISIVAFLVLMIAGFIRSCCIKPEDESYSTATRFIGMNRIVEIKNMPKSLINKELLTAVASLVFPENEPPVGLIEGNVTDDKSIRKLSEEERKQFQEKEREEIQKHQHKIAEEVRNIQQQALLEQTTQTNTNNRKKQA